MNTERPRLLIVEDDSRLGSIMCDVLGSTWEVSLATDLSSARDLLTRQVFVVAVLDRRLPDGDGAELVTWMRRRANATPVLILTALGTTMDKVEGLDAGANDYLVKPFEFDELNARLRALTRDYSNPHGGIAIGNWIFFPDLRVIESPYTGRIVLTEKESALLAALVRHPDAVFTRDQLLATVFDIDDQAGTVDTYVHYVRHKTEKDLIDTVHGMGYRLGTPT